MHTITQTYTKTDIRRVFENFQADLQMLAVRTQAMESDLAQKFAYDICLMAQEEFLKRIHMQLYDSSENLIKVHRYSVEGDILSDSQRPGENRWPCIPDGSLHVIIELSDTQKWKELNKSGKLKITWGPSRLSTDYSAMRSDGGRLYSSNGYGLRRETFVN